MGRGGRTDVSSCQHWGAEQNSEQADRQQGPGQLRPGPWVTQLLIFLHALQALHVAARESAMSVLLGAAPIHRKAAKISRNASFVMSLRPAAARSTALARIRTQLECLECPHAQHPSNSSRSRPAGCPQGTDHEGMEA